jgi:hypothetical protein
MGNIDNYDEKAAYNQRSHSQHSKSTSYSSISSSASSNSCTGDKHNYYKLDACPCSHPYQKIADAKQRESGKRVRFMVEKPLPPGWVMNWNLEVERKGGVVMRGSHKIGGKRGGRRRKSGGKMVDKASCLMIVMTRRMTRI